MLWQWKNKGFFTHLLFPIFRHTHDGRCALLSLSLTRVAQPSAFNALLGFHHLTLHKIVMLIWIFWQSTLVYVFPGGLQENRTKDPLGLFTLRERERRDDHNVIKGDEGKLPFIFQTIQRRIYENETMNNVLMGSASNVSPRKVSKRRLVWSDFGSSILWYGRMLF